jgi:adenylate kinase
MHVILMGPQGAGKGTQALRVAPRLGLVHLSTGDLFRAAIAASTPLGREVKGYLDRGELVPDSVTIGVVEQRLEEIARGQAGGDAKGALFDGFPRTHPQAEGLDAALGRRGERVSTVVFIEVPLEVLITRLAGRRVCKRCAAVYHVEFNPPRRPGVCDRCGGELVQRDDDKPGPVKKRLDLYFQETAPLLAYYRERGLLTTVNGNQSIDRVSEDIVRAVQRARPPES